MNSPREIIKKEDGFLAYYFSAQVAYVVVRATERLPLVPNHFTALSLLLGLAAAWQFAVGTTTSLWVGVVLLHVSFILDCADGQLSRLKQLQSKTGHWFDYHSDKLKDGALLAGFAYAAYTMSNETNIWIFLVAFAAIFFQFLRNISALNRDIFLLKHSGAADRAHTILKPTSNNQLLRTLKNSSLFKLSDRVLLYTIFGVLTEPALGIIVYAILETFFSCVSALLTYKTTRSLDRAA